MKLLPLALLPASHGTRKLLYVLAVRGDPLARCISVPECTSIGCPNETWMVCSGIKQKIHSSGLALRMSLVPGDLAAYKAGYTKVSELGNTQSRCNCLPLLDPWWAVPSSLNPDKCHMGKTKIWVPSVHQHCFNFETET
ncbi:hypothetical protein AVEN_169734-1 [Araneus ventricosus]|uniref:Uncharacterized protein n=1 Tax=Araneus ventricosus TaxID=182803 RepID=A0A4Y2V5V2_ARAVE|nr:hypothetical protein AVEN_169734-1 [Araneus ventricosus]